MGDTDVILETVSVYDEARDMLREEGEFRDAQRVQKDKLELMQELGVVEKEADKLEVEQEIDGPDSSGSVNFDVTVTEGSSVSFGGEDEDEVDDGDSSDG